MQYEPSTNAFQMQCERISNFFLNERSRNVLVMTKIFVTACRIDTNGVRMQFECSTNDTNAFQISTYAARIKIRTAFVLIRIK